MTPELRQLLDKRGAKTLEELGITERSASRRRYKFVPVEFTAEEAIADMIGDLNKTPEEHRAEIDAINKEWTPYHVRCLRFIRGFFSKKSNK